MKTTIESVACSCDFCGGEIRESDLKLFEIKVMSE